MDENTKVPPQFMLDRLRSGEPLLPPLVIRHASFESERAGDVLLEVAFNGAADTERFTVECKIRYTKDDFRQATQQAANNAKQRGGNPLIFLPYLSPDRLAELESMAVSGIDLCGNGIVYVPKLARHNTTRYQRRRPGSRT